MRDIVVVLIVIVFSFRALSAKRPDIALNLYTWISLMNPHRLCWGFATSAPLAQVAALATLGSLFISKDPKRLPLNGPSILLLLFVIWMFITTLFAMNPSAAWVEMDRTWKTQLVTILIMMIATSEERIRNLMWVITLSLAFFGFKGGIFTILSGGGARVWGPSGSFIAGNNEIGMALIMTIPLLRYLQLNIEDFRIRLGLAAVMVLSFFCVLGTQSRGSLLGMAAMVGFLVLKSRNKLPMLLLLAVSIPAVLAFMPESWYQRMNTIKTYQQDASAMGRINAWHTAVNIAKDRVLGGGYKCLHKWQTFVEYAPNKHDVHDAHSIYFEVLGEHGFIGLFLFILLAYTSWRMASKTIVLARKRPEMKWMGDLCSMIQVSIVGYFVNGLFLGMAMFDLYYDLIAVVVACNVLITKQASLAASTDPAVSPKGIRQFVRAAGRTSGGDPDKPLATP